MMLVNNIFKLQEKNLFLKDITALEVFKEIGEEYERNYRFQIESDYTFKKLVVIFLGEIFLFSNVTLRFIKIKGYIGLLFAKSNDSIPFTKT